MIHGLHRSCLERGATNILGLLSRTDRKAFKVVGTSMECDFRLPRFTSEAILGLTSNAIELNYIELWANSKKKAFDNQRIQKAYIHNVAPTDYLLHLPVDPGPVGVRGVAPYFSGLGWFGADAKKRKVEK